MREESFAGDVVDQFAERFAERQDFAEVVGRKIRPRYLRIGTFAADLDDANDLFSRKDGSANHFLDNFTGFAGDFDAFKDRGVTYAGEIVDDFGSAFACGFGGDGRGAGKRNEADLFERLGDEKMQMTPACGNTHERDFIVLHADVLSDALGDAGEGNVGGRRVRVEGGSDALEIRHEAEAGNGHSLSV
jgi:hypothetical protein